MDPSQVRHSSWINLGTIFSNGFCSQHQCFLSKPTLRNSLLCRRSEISVQSHLPLSGQRWPSTDFQGQLKKLSLTGSSAYAASAPVPQEMGTTAQRLFLQTHACVLDSTVIQPLAFVNELTELVNFILSEACWLNPPASVSLNNNSTFPLFPWLIMS